MIEVEITPQMRKRAKYYADKLGTLHKSVTRGRGNVTGMLGEIMYLEVFGGEWLKDDRDCDIITHNGLDAEIKTKSCSSPPKLEYNCSVYGYNRQDCDIYVFTRVHKDYKKGWLLGWIKHDDFYDKARFYKKGDKEDGRWTLWEDTYMVYVGELNAFTEEFL